MKLPHRRQKPILSHAKGNGAQIRGVGKSVIRHPTSLMVLVASPGPSSGGVHDELGIDVHRDRPKPSILGAMDCQHFTMKQKRKRKKPVARTPEAVAKFEELFLKQLALGRSPGVAARKVRIARATAYGWKKEDQEFDAAWRDAVETGLDVLETSVYNRGLKDGGEDARFILVHRRYKNADVVSQPNFVLNITLAEHTKRLERLGLPVPQIEGDYEPEDFEQIKDAATPNT